MILTLLPLIILAAAQECPYCRWDACQVRLGSLASCSDCHTGVLVNMVLKPTENTYNPPTLGICQLCPPNCNTCELADLPQEGTAGLKAINCTSCASGYTRNPDNGQCVQQTR